jgi:hypothetical protein
MNPIPEIQTKHWNVTETMSGEVTRFPYRELTLTWHFDPGHAWLQVHRETLEDFNFDASDFSEFSYADSHYLYLEEDCDAGKFMRAVGDKAEIEFKERECDSTFNVRALGRNR